MIFELIADGTTTGASEAVQPDLNVVHRPGAKRTFQAKGSTSASTGSASVAVQVSNDGTNWLTLGTITLSLSTSESSDGFSSDSPWEYVRGNVLSISGTDATVSLLMGV